MREAGIGLPKALRQKGEEHHHAKADVETPETERKQLVVPVRRIGESTPAEQREA